MSVLTGAERAGVSTPKLATESLRGALLWLMGFAGAFVFVEPSPYEIVATLTIFAFAVLGLSLQPALAPLLILLVLMNIGYAMAVVQVADQPRLIIWVLVSAFLATTALFYAAMLGSHTQSRLKWILRGTLAAGVIASLVAIAAYFRMFGARSELFLLYDRARGTFNDPNVLGAFLVLPALLTFQRVLAGRFAAVIGNGLLLIVLLTALLLSFSRAAWGQFVFCAMLLMVMTFVTTSSPSERIRIITIALVGALAAATLVAALLSIGGVAELFKQRASLDQSYDSGHFGRFGRYILGAELALDRPFGIGPLQFAKLFFEDAHNTFLNSFMAGGWLAGFCYLTLTLVTASTGLRFVFMPTPWQSTYHVVYAAYLGVVLESAIIDIDHWRHYFLILGLLWGLMGASRGYAEAAGRRPEGNVASGRSPGLAIHRAKGLHLLNLHAGKIIRPHAEAIRSVAQPG